MPATWSPTATARPPTIYGYNNRGRLATLTVGSTQTSSYSYDGLDRLAIDASPYVPLSGITQYVYDRAGHLLAESDDSGNTLTEYVWLDDMPIALIANVATSPTLYFVHTDHLNRPIMMTNANKAIVWQADYDPFGGANSITGSAINNLRFPGQYFLMEDGLHYNWYRHYDPTIGRFIQPDPLGHINGASLYAYVRGNPILLIDPLGLWTGQVGFSVNLTTPFGTLQYTAGIAFDGQGNVGTYQSFGGGSGFGEGASGGVSANWSNADTICDLQGPFDNLTVTGGDGLAGSADSFYGTSGDGRAVAGGGVTVGFGGGAGAGVTVTTTSVIPLLKF